MRRLACIAMLAGLSGCSSFSSSNLEGLQPVTVAEIHRAISCEFYYALSATTENGVSPFDTWGALVELNLTATDSINLVPTLGALSAKAGNATLSAKANNLTVADMYQDQNQLNYAVAFQRSRAGSGCAAEHSPTSSTGLGLADFLVAEAEIEESGGKLFPTTALTTSQSTAVGTIVPTTLGNDQIAIDGTKQPFIKYIRTFTISRKVGGGLTFSSGPVSISIDNNASGRARTMNTITVTMQNLVVKKSPGGLTPMMSAPATSDALEDFATSVLQQRESELNTLKGTTPTVVVVNQPPAP